MPASPPISTFEDETVPLDRALQAMEPAKRLRFVILDACRENPFLKSMRRTVATRSVSRGLGRVEPSAANTLIAFATKPNAVAEDGTGRNSPFTAALVKHLLTPDLDLRLALGKVRDDVMAATGGRQEPYLTSSLGGEVVAIVPGTGSGLATLARNEAAEAWAAVKDSTSVAQLEVIAGRYKGTVYADLARARIVDLKKQQIAITTEAPKSAAAVDAFNSKRAVVPLTAIEERAVRPKDSFKECDVCPEMVVVAAGSYVMGSPTSEVDRASDEGPQHRVTIAGPLAVGKFEVTRGEFAAFMRETGRDTDWCVTLEGGEIKERAGDPSVTQDLPKMTDTPPCACIGKMRQPSLIGSPVRPERPTDC